MHERHTLATPEQIESTILGKFLAADQIDRICTCSGRMQLVVGEFLFREGETQFLLHVLLHGQLDLVMQVPGRGSQRILSIGPGELVGWSALVGQGVMTCSALCIQKADVIAIDALALRELMESDHELGYQFMRMMSQALSARLTATRLQLLDLFAPVPHATEYLT